MSDQYFKFCKLIFGELHDVAFHICNTFKTIIPFSFKDFILGFYGGYSSGPFEKKQAISRNILKFCLP